MSHRTPALLKRVRATLAAALIASAALSVAAAPLPQAAAGPPSHAQAHAPDRILVKFKPGVSESAIAALNRANGAAQKEALPRIGVRVLTVPKGRTVEQMVARYRADSRVEFAEPDALAQALLVPNDPLYTRQWAPPMVNAPAAWDVTVGSNSVVVAVLDTGVDVAHPELAGRAVPGYDFINGQTAAADDNGHGTRAAGIALAAGNNGIGVAGMDWRARVMPVKVLDSTGSGSWSAVAKGLTFAADNGAHVINLSLGGPASSTLHSAIKYAHGKNCVLVASSGNQGSSTPMYPAAYPETIAVGSVYRDVLSSFSNFGPHIDVVAPGETIDTIAPGGLYGRFTGTSASAPFVTGLASLIKAQAPSATAEQVREAINRSARDLGASGWDPYYGWGHIDAAAALARFSAPAPAPVTAPEPEPAPSPAPAPEPAPAPADTTAPQVALASPSAGAIVSGTVTLLASATDDVGVARVEFYINGKLVGSTTSSPYSVRWNTSKLANGGYEVVVRAVDTSGNSASTAPVTLFVNNATKGGGKK